MRPPINIGNTNYALTDTLPVQSYQVQHQAWKCTLQNISQSFSEKENLIRVQPDIKHLCGKANKIISINKHMTELEAITHGNK